MTEQPSSGPGPGAPDLPDGVLDIRGHTLDWVEREVYAYALRTHGSQRKAARALGIARTTFNDKTKRFGLVAAEPTPSKEGS